VLRELLLGKPDRTLVVAPTRRALDIADPRLVAPVVDFGSASADKTIAEAITDHAGGRVDAYVCCLGTTIRTAGSREAFIAVDRELVLRMAQLARGHGARRAILVSSAGASRQSGNFYLRVKGEVEDAMEKLGFERLDILQPGLLLGDRSERRPAEALFQRLAPISNLLMQGKRLRGYRAIEVAVVAKAITAMLRTDSPGTFCHGYDAIREWAGQAA
jgi:uncharacterized protein YbjT (DUF2867 family)